MHQLKEQLGKVLTPKDLAEYLGLDVKTIREYYPELGGIRLGHRILFFEKEVINAVQTWREVGGPGEKGGHKEGKNISDEEGGSGVGSGDQENINGQLEQEDRHGLFG